MFYNLSEDLLDAYSYADDQELQKSLHAWDRVYIDAMLSYDAGVSGFGKQMMAHQNRVSKLGKEFLLYLGYSERAAHNFRAAMLFHDIGKTHSSYNPLIWNLYDRPTPEEKRLQKRHARLGADMWQGFARRHNFLNHPHASIRHAVTLYHHERCDRNGPENENLERLPVYVQVSCLVDTFDGDQIYRPHQESKRTPQEALKRMLGYDGQQKYQGAFPYRIMQRFSRFIQIKYSFTIG